jgi:hypothetical protein
LVKKKIRRFAAIFTQKTPKKISPLRGDFNYKNTIHYAFVRIINVILFSPPQARKKNDVFDPFERIYH